MKQRILDKLGRPLKDLRISVTDRCNFRCQYCMPEEIFGRDYVFLPKHKLLSFEEISRIVRIFASLGVTKIRITGGEPLLRKDLPELIRMISSTQMIEDIALTTNGVLLPHLALKLKQAGLQRINVSLDTLDNERFSQLNSRYHHVQQVLDGIEAAHQAGLEVKVNMVVMKGINDDEIITVARYFRDTETILRFIEFMDVGNTNGWNLKQVISKQEIVERIHAEMPIEKINPNYFGEVATRYRYIGTHKEFGVISSITEPFCTSCTRARLSSDGHLYTCLFASSGYNLLEYVRSGATDEEVKAKIIEIWQARMDRYSEERLQQTRQSHRQKIEMSYIGG
ncbi:GTP 3',8-cyclase MoaA [Thermoflavimicrobium daqui]|jgi:cyclic pyranopterin phosphate synthase|uniref:GTP 3',8-cyclase n=1 Tax=Thermoflavimicrobium daqui TaxID=2137476 RepID=A0A364K733_9BACL|nr:GTP 3',8-cyclase MoaA [Thermoflavimicrobium daqui]RAL26088.1 GTP 3',8-cyclase MoaA [Thermoflavimicrobium daqui]